jgi:ABC-type sugar transport system substrate-binding protein
MEERLATYPELKLVATKYPGEDQNAAFQDSQDLIKKFPGLRGIFGITSVSFPGAAEAVKQAGKTGTVLVTGLSTPNDMKPYVRGGEVRSVMLWNTMDLGYLTVVIAEAVHAGRLVPGSGATEVEAGRLGKVTVQGDQVLLGDAQIFTRDNIDNYDF